MADTAARETRPAVELDRAVIRFAGDSGDGMQLTGDRFTTSSAIFGNDLSTLPDFPAEIRAPAGTLAGVSAFQVHISDHDILTPGDHPERAGRHEPGRPQDQRRRPDRRRDAHRQQRRLRRAGPDQGRLCRQPADDGSLGALHGLRGADDLAHPGGRQAVRHQAPRRRAVQELLRSRPGQLAVHPAHRADRSSGSRQRFGKTPMVAEANTLAFKAGWNFGETAELFPSTYEVKPAALRAGQLHQHLRATPRSPGA